MIHHSILWYDLEDSTSDLRKERILTTLEMNLLSGDYLLAIINVNFRSTSLIILEYWNCFSHKSNTHIKYMHLSTTHRDMWLYEQ